MNSAVPFNKFHFGECLPYRSRNAAMCRSILPDYPFATFRIATILMNPGAY